MILRNVRPVALGAGTAPSAEPVDLRLGEGVVVEASPVLEADGGPEYDADGRWVIPGLWDAHVHLGQWTAASARLDLGDVHSVPEALDRVAARLREQPGQPVVGWGHRPTGWPETPTVAALDVLGTDQPVVLIAGDGHHAWLNTVGLRALQLPLRDDMVTEGEWFTAYGRLDALTGDAATPQAYRREMLRAAALGVTGVVDFEFGGSHGDWAERWHAGADVLRVRVATYADGLDDVIAAGRRTGDPLVPGDPRLTMGSLKIISDGSLNTGTAWCCEAYAAPAASGLAHGQPNQSPEELTELVARGHEHGLTAAVHAIGDRAVTVALDVFAATGARGTIEHVQLVRPEDLERMARLGVLASVQPAHLLDDRDLTEQLWPGQGGRCFALRSMRQHGVPLAFGSDAPVAPLDPWLAMAAAVHRSADQRDAWHPEQALTAPEALAASVDGQPTVGAGSRADLVLLDADPLATEDDPAAAAAHLRAMRERVHATLVGGRIVGDTL